MSDVAIKKEIVQMYRSGMLQKEIILRTGKPMSLVREAVAEYKRERDKVRAAILKLHNNGKNNAQIANITGESLASVTSIVAAEKRRRKSYFVRNREVAPTRDEWISAWMEDLG